MERTKENWERAVVWLHYLEEKLRTNVDVPKEEKDIIQRKIDEYWLNVFTVHPNCITSTNVFYGLFSDVGKVPNNGKK